MNKETENTASIFFGETLGTFGPQTDEVIVFIIEIMLVGVLFFFLEKLRPAEKNTPFFKKDLKNEFLIAFANIGVFQPLFNLVLAYTIISLLTPLIPYQMFDEAIQAWPLTLQIIVACLILDFSVYWRHRFTHFYMWSYHSVHHSAKQLTWLTSMRLHPVDVLTAMIFDTVILHIFGFTGAGILGAIFIMKFWNYFTHTNIDLQFDKPIRYIFASPNFHRWHHATVREAYDKNFCAMFSFYDYIFGTYYHPEELPAGYGLSKREQENYPDDLLGWFAYPFKRDYKRFKRKLAKLKKDDASDEKKA